VLEIDHLTKAFVPSRLAVDDISFSVAEGEIFGLLGHNGAGKSTLLGCTLGMVYPDAGEVRIGGISVQQNRAAALRQVGAIFEAPAFYDYLSGWRNLKILAALSGFTDEAKLREAVKMVNLTSRIHQPVGTYSHGMRQRLALAQALVPEPRLLLLDEPTDGLDPEGIREFREFVLRLRKERGMTILFNSHLLAEVEHMCDRIAIVKSGRLLYVGDGKDLRQPRQRVRWEVDRWPELLQIIERFGGEAEPSEGATVTHLPLACDIADIVSQAVAQGLRLRGIEPLKETLEELYLKVGASD
jgi:ABC-2 type transport system ATP-binding protein